jgi:hypothetical protein
LEFITENLRKGKVKKMKKADFNIIKRFGLAFAMFLLCVSLQQVNAQVIEDSSSSDWSLFSYDYSNSNYNPKENDILRGNVQNLTRAWETFNDDSLVPEPPPTGFILESVLGLQFPNSVVGVVASPIITDGTIYYIDALGTMFARDAKTGGITNPNKHWTRTLVDPDYDNAANPILPDLYYTSPVVTKTHVWVHSSVYGRLHAIKRNGGNEVDFDNTTTKVDPYKPILDQNFASSLGEPVIIKDRNKILFVAGINIILNDAVLQGKESGLLFALDITDPVNPSEVWRTYTVDINPATGLRYGTGVSAGSGFAVDKKRKMIFGGNGQNTSKPYSGYPDPAQAPAGYIDRSDALWAVNYRTGEFVWVNQFHVGDVFDLNNPIPAGPNNPNGAVDADVLAPPILFSAKDSRHPSRNRDLAGDGSKGGLFRVVDRDTGETVWERVICKQTGLGGIQAGAAVAKNNVYVAGFEGIDDGFSDAQFDAPGSIYLNAFFATFSPAFWADAEDTNFDGDPSTGMRIKVYSLNAATGASNWNFPNGKDYIELLSGAAMRHVTVANGLVYVTTSSGELFVLDERNGNILFQDQTLDLNAHFNLGLGKPHHAGMNSGTIVADGMVYTPYGSQNNPSGGIIAYKLP